MPYYFYQFDLSAHNRFSHAVPTGYPTFLAEVVKPLVARFPTLLYYFQRIPTGVQLCFSTRDKAVNRALTRYLKMAKVVPSRQPNLQADSLIGAFGSPGSRFLAQAHHTSPHRRALVVLKFLQGICDLYLDQLMPAGGGAWTVENNVHHENPLGNNFESLAHLLANITGFEFEIEVDYQANVRTGWMANLPNPVLVTRRCHY